MANVFLLLLLLSLGLLIWGLVSPKSLSKFSNKPLSRKRSGIGFGVIVMVSFVLFGITANPAVSPTKATLKASFTADKQKNTITTKQVTETQTINFTSTNQDDGGLAKGQTQVAQAGKNGLKTLIYKVTYSNGKQTSKTLVSSVVTTQPVNQIVDVGSYVAPATSQAPVSSSTPAAPTSNSTSTPSANTQPQPTSCYPLTNGGNCYEPGEYCRDSDHGTSGVAGDGEAITCEDNNGWRWEPS
jgi:hypothetical protein